MQGMEQIPGERLIGMEELFVMKNVLSRLSMIMLLSIFLWCKLPYNDIMGFEKTIVLLRPIYSMIGCMKYKM